jgi:hypothetical protein
MSATVPGVGIPDSMLAREITELVRDTASPLLFHHSSRTRPARSAALPNISRSATSPIAPRPMRPTAKESLRLLLDSAREFLRVGGKNTQVTASQHRRPSEIQRNLSAYGAREQIREHSR